ncbi:MAG: hypothetical protein BalsKO_20760 [Balneolaceae bacterium]
MVNAQQLNTISETDEYIEYEILNSDLGVYPPYEFMVPYKNGQPQFTLIDQNVTEVQTQISDSKAMGLALSTSESPLYEVLSPGMYRGKQVGSLKIHLARYSSNSVLITSKITFKVFKVPNTIPELPSNKKINRISNHPLSSGNWYKIPIGEKGLYQLNQSYLQDLGIETTSIDPRNIQIWGTDGHATS